MAPSIVGLLWASSENCLPKDEGNISGYTDLGTGALRTHSLLRKCNCTQKSFQSQNPA